MRENIPSVISAIDPLTTLLLGDKAAGQTDCNCLQPAGNLRGTSAQHMNIHHQGYNKYIFILENTYKELMSLGIVRGICEVPTQMIVSLEQEHPEGHL